MEFITLSGILDWAAFIALIVVGIIAIIGFFDRESHRRQQEGDAADDRLIKLLKGTVDSLEKQVDELSDQVQELSKKVQKLQTENRMLRSILQGKDEKTAQIREKAQNAIEVSYDTNALVKSNNENIEKLYKTLTQHLQRVEELFNR